MLSRDERSGDDEAAGTPGRSHQSWWARLLDHLGVVRGQQALVVEVAAPQAPLPTAERIFYEVARLRLDAQLARTNAFDARASTMFTIGSTVLPITTSLLTTERGDVLDDLTSRWALGAGCGFYILLVAAFVLSYRLAELDTRPELVQWREITVGRTEEQMHRWLGNACIEAYRSNEPQLRRKAALVGLVLWMLAGEATALTLAVLTPLW